MGDKDGRGCLEMRFKNIGSLEMNIKSHQFKSLLKVRKLGLYLNLVDLDYIQVQSVLF